MAAQNFDRERRVEGPNDLSSALHQPLETLLIEVAQPSPFGVDLPESLVRQLLPRPHETREASPLTGPPFDDLAERLARSLLTAQMIVGLAVQRDGGVLLGPRP